MEYKFNPRRHPPMTLAMTVHTVCNLNCKMCRMQEYVERRECILEPEIVIKALSQFKKLNPTGCVNFMSGEIFANRKTMYPYLEYCKKINLPVVIVTNGTLVNEDDLALLKNNLTCFIVSLESHKEEVHDYIRGKGTYKKVIKLLKLLNTHRIQYKIATVVNKLNIDHLNEMHDFLKSHRYFSEHDFSILGKSFFRDTDTDPFYQEHAFQTRTEKVHAIRKLTDYLLHTKGNKSSYTYEVHKSVVDLIQKDETADLSVPMCNIFERVMVIRQNGDVGFCYDEGMPAALNISEGDFDLRRIWESPEAQEIRKDMSQCLKRCGIFLCNNKKLSFNHVV